MSRTPYQKMKRDIQYNRNLSRMFNAMDRHDTPFKYHIDHIEWKKSSYMVYFKGLYKPVNIIDPARKFFGRLTADVRRKIEETMPKALTVEGNTREIYQQGCAYNFGGYRTDFHIDKHDLYMWFNDAQGTLNEKLEKVEKAQGIINDCVLKLSDILKEYDVEITGEANLLDSYINAYIKLCHFTSPFTFHSTRIYISPDTDIKDIFNEIPFKVAQLKYFGNQEQDAVIPDRILQQHRTDPNTLVCKFTYVSNPYRDNEQGKCTKYTVFLNKKDLVKCEGGYQIRPESKWENIHALTEKQYESSHQNANVAIKSKEYHYNYYDLAQDVMAKKLAEASDKIYEQVRDTLFNLETKSKSKTTFKDKGEER